MEVVRSRSKSVTKILALNAGSSSLRARLLDFQDQSSDRFTELWSAHLESGGNFDAVLRSIWEGSEPPVGSPSEIRAVGHRIVHGGDRFGTSVRIDAEVKDEIARLATFAPLHNTTASEGIEAAERLIPKADQFAVFDTGFHQTLPDAAKTYPGPYEWLENGIRRFGFHGISHRYAARRAAEILRRELDSLRLITCHLGSGASLAAVACGISVDTTMGFTPLEGLMMGTRSGTVDPGIVTHLMRATGCSGEEIDRMLNERSGLKGLSGISGDMREIMAAKRGGNARARLTFDVYVHRLCRELGGMLASLGALDGLVFTGGIGENIAELREIVCERFGFLGLELDKGKNVTAAEDGDLAQQHSRVRVLLVHADEETEIARECLVHLR